MREIVAEIVTIGDEILYGQITDTNSQWLGEQLSLMGIKLKRKISVGDELPELLQIFQESESRADIIILTGGLGPTSDDITKPALCQYFGCGLEMDEEVLAHVTDFFVKRNRPMIETNKQQAAVPEIASVLFNRLGTAPGLWIERNDKVFISLPGVPHEMKEIMASGGFPKLKAKFNPPVIVHKVIRTVGVGESFLAEMIKDWEVNLPPHIRLAYLPSLGMLKLRLTAKGNNEAALEIELAEQTVLLEQIISPYIFGYDSTELEQAVGLLLKAKNLTIATAESCTGGAISSIITSVSGASAYYLGSVIAYNNSIKTTILGVKPATLTAHGAVSEEVIREMAEGVRQKLGADIAVATSGVAGPTGGTPEKPVGTIWIAFSDKSKTITKKLQLTTERKLNVQITIAQVLNMIRENA